MRYREHQLLSDSERPKREVAAYWVISVSDRSLHQILTFDYEGNEVLPVFSFKEEALLYAQYGSRETERDVMRRSGDEILDLLLTGECQDADVIALDPVPEFRHERETLRLTLISRDSFIVRLFEV